MVPLLQRGNEDDGVSGKGRVNITSLHNVFDRLLREASLRHHGIVVTGRMLPRGPGFADDALARECETVVHVRNVGSSAY